MARTTKALAKKGPAPAILVRLDKEARAELARLSRVHKIPQAEVVRRLILRQPLTAEGEATS